jgi:predicted transposase YbfD/YdcC
LTPAQRANLRCWFNPRTRRYDVPTENCFYRVLKAVPVSAFQQALWAWQKARLGAADGDVVVLDGKALRGSGRTQLVGAINARSGRTVGVETVADKSNEIPAGQTLLDRLDLDGTIALMDAMHTQVETARVIVQEGGGGLRAGCQRQPGRSPKASQPLPPGSLFPLSIKRWIKATAASNGAASRSRK